jgi:putative transposase
MGRPKKERAPLPPIWRLSRCRGILIRWEKKAQNHLVLLQLACGLLWFRRYDRLTAT